MELAAVVVVPDEREFMVAEPQSHPLPPLGCSVSSSLLPILGNDVLQTWTDRVQKLGVNSFWLASKPAEDREVRGALGRLSWQGIERFLMIKLKSYAEMDLMDLVRFHCQSRNSVTEVQDSQGQLGVSVLDQLMLSTTSRRRKPSAAATRSERNTYAFRGYAKRILSSIERQELVGDALTGACAMRPVGREIRDQVWVGEGANIAGSVRIVGPTYLGDRTVVRAGATVGPFSSIERDCVVDWGTTVERSTVLPNTYLAPGLLIRNALVDGGYLEDMERGVVADLEPGGLARRMQATDSSSQVLSCIRTADSPPANAEWRELQI